MEDKKRYSAVIFDLDGVILDTEGISYDAWKRAVADFGGVLDDDVYRSIVGLKTTDIEEVFHLSFGQAFPLAEVSKRRSEYIQEYIAENGVEIKPGFNELNSFLESRGLHKAVATSSTRFLAARKLKRAGLIDKFDAIVCGDEVANGKPAPDIFLEAAKHLGVKPEECLVLEDSENGVRAAHAAGMNVILIPDLIEPSEEIAELAEEIFTSLCEVSAFLQQSPHEDG